MKQFTFLTVLLFIALTGSHATIRGVPGTYTTIQSAINSSVNGDTVLVEPGTYFENINFRGKKIVVTSRFYISNNLTYISSTTINGSTPANPDSASCVIINNGEDSTTVLQGFTITGGTGTKWLDEHFAGVFREGGGILTALTSPVIRFNIIKNNSAMDITGVNGTGGGGIRSGDGKPRILNNIIMNNTGRYGAGVVLNYAGCIMKNNIIYGNSLSQSYNSGSAIWVNSNLAASTKIIENNTIVGNSSLNGTAGIAILSTSMILRNNIIWNNTSPGNTQILLSGGTVTATYNDIMGGYTGTGNVNTNPLFTDSNFVLANNSPCIDAGDTSAIYNDPLDPTNPPNAKFPAKGLVRNDMGAYGGPLSSVIAAVRIIEVKKNSSLIPDKFELFQNYPNPFNPSTIIKFSIPENGKLKMENSIVSLKVYNILGKEIATLINENLSPGTYEVQFSNNQISSGVYFYKLIAGDFAETKKMTLIK